MNTPPPILDGARVLWWAWSGDVPFGEMPGAPEPDRWIHGFAICRYDSGSTYRFSCNRYWEVVQDEDCGDSVDAVEGAKARIPLQYDRSRVNWIEFH